MSQAVDFKLDKKGNSAVEATYYMAFHTILKTSSEYYGAIKEARLIAENITDMINSDIHRLGGNSTAHVFPYRLVPHTSTFIKLDVFTIQLHSVFIYLNHIVDSMSVWVKNW